VEKEKREGGKAQKHLSWRSVGGEEKVNSSMKRGRFEGKEKTGQGKSFPCSKGGKSCSIRGTMMGYQVGVSDRGKAFISGEGKKGKMPEGVEGKKNVKTIRDKTGGRS